MNDILSYFIFHLNCFKKSSLTHDSIDYKEIDFLDNQIVNFQNHVMLQNQ